MDILAGSRDQTFSSQLLGLVYFNCKCAMLTYDLNNTIQTLIMLYIKVLFITLIFKSLHWLRFCPVNFVSISDEAFYFQIVSVFSKKLLIEDNVLRLLLETGPPWLVCRAKAVYHHFSIILRPWIVVRPQRSTPRPSALQTSAVPLELLLLR